jgi:hypothetical protein
MAVLRFLIKAARDAVAAGSRDISGVAGIPRDPEWVRIVWPTSGAFLARSFPLRS